jgi:pyruvate dehydrogenase E1 component beta subunit
MERDDKILVWGEGVTSKIAFDHPELLQKYPERIFAMPISEGCIVGAGLGASLVGAKPVIDLSFDDLAPRVMDEMLNHAAKVRYVTAGESRCSMIVKMDLPPVRCAQTGQRLESLFMHIPGIVIAVPSTPQDAKGLMTTSLRADDLVLMVEDRWITTKQEVPEEDYEIPFGRAAIKTEGSDITVLTYGYMVLQAMELVEYFGKKGIGLEVVDLRTLAPIDMSSIEKSIKKTGRVIVLEGGWKTCGVGAEICSLIAENLMNHLVAPPVRLAAKNTHIPTSAALRMKVFPTTEEIISSVETAMAGNR